jgi:hypothetical protein
MLNAIPAIHHVLKLGIWFFRSGDLELPQSAPWMTE